MCSQKWRKNNVPVNNENNNNNNNNNKNNNNKTKPLRSVLKRTTGCVNSHWFHYNVIMIQCAAKICTPQIDKRQERPWGREKAWSWLHIKAGQPCGGSLLSKKRPNIDSQSACWQAYSPWNLSLIFYESQITFAPFSSPSRNLQTQSCTNSAVMSPLCL